MSQPHCIMVNSRKYHRSISGTEPTEAGIMLLEPTRTGIVESRSTPRNGGGGGGHDAGASGRSFFAFRGSVRGREDRRAVTGFARRFACPVGVFTWESWWAR